MRIRFNEEYKIKHALYNSTIFKEWEHKQAHEATGAIDWKLNRFFIQGDSYDLDNEIADLVYTNDSISVNGKKYAMREEHVDTFMTSIISYASACKKLTSSPMCKLCCITQKFMDGYLVCANRTRVINTYKALAEEDIKSVLAGEKKDDWFLGVYACHWYSQGYSNKYKHVARPDGGHLVYLPELDGSEIVEIVNMSNGDPVIYVRVKSYGAFHYYLIRLDELDITCTRNVYSPESQTRSTFYLGSDKANIKILQDIKSRAGIRICN